MIPILYKADSKDFSTFGIGALSECTSCVVREERNGEYELTLKYPINGKLYKELVKDRIVKAKPNEMSNPQAFRIYRVTTPINGIATVYAQHISYDLAYIGVMPFSLEAVTPTRAIEFVFKNALTEHNFTFQTDYSSAKDFVVESPQSIRACLGGTKGSLVNQWGGEFEWDNFKVIHHQGRGNNNGVVIEYGKNLTKLDHDLDSTEVYTDLLPYAVSTDENGNETIITLAEQIIPIVENASHRKTRIRDFTDSFDEGDVIDEEHLRIKAEKYVKNNPLGEESPTIKIAFEPLWQQSEYAAVLERVSLCDTVTIKHTVLGITTKSKVIETEYDTLAEKYVSITLGSARSNLAVSVADMEEQIEDTQKSVERFPKLLTSAISNATKLITGNTGGYVVLHTSGENGKPYELLIMDSDDINKAVNVWRWNVGGLGFSSNGYNGPYETAITNDGAIVADFITTGSLVANIIKAGVLSSLDGSSYWNIETGEVVLKAYATTETVEEQTSRIDNIESQKMYRLVITSSNGNIFKNGNISTTLTATVYSWDTNITDTLDDNQFIWTRVSDDEEADKKWNADHFGGSKSITITNDDVKIRATFCCDLIDTTTRRSLL